jgi:hypothetical membrane protein
MIWLSVVIAILLGTLHTYFYKGSVNTPISFDLVFKNPMAWALIALLWVMIIVFALCLIKHRQSLRAAVLIIIGIVLGVVCVVKPYERLHDDLFWLMALLTFDWFFVTASDYGCRGVKYGSIACLVIAPMIFWASPGIAERVIILGFLVGTNVLYKICGREPIVSIKSSGVGATGGSPL